MYHVWEQRVMCVRDAVMMMGVFVCVGLRLRLLYAVCVFVFIVICWLVILRTDLFCLRWSGLVWSGVAWGYPLLRICVSFVFFFFFFSFILRSVECFIFSFLFLLLHVCVHFLPLCSIRASGMLIWPLSFFLSSFLRGLGLITTSFCDLVLLPPTYLPTG